MLALVASSAHAWWCTGHMTVAEIAAQNLDDNVYTTVQGIVANFSQSGPFPANPDLMQLGCWADDIKRNDFSMAGWHFKNIPYNPDNVPATEDNKLMTVDKVLPIMDKAIRKWPNNWELQFALANLVHFYGDIHQPLHVTELFNAQFPTGDLGGNLFNVTVNNTKTELHAVWDSICWQYTVEQPRPLAPSAAALVRNLAQQYQSQYNFTEQQISAWNTTEFAQEGYKFAVAYAYNGIQPHDTLSPAYIARCKVRAEERIALGGLRLASELNYLFGRGQTREVTAEHIYSRMHKVRAGMHAFVKANPHLARKHKK